MLLVDQPGQHLGFAVARRHHGFRVACAHRVDHAAARRLDLALQVADFHADPDTDLVAQADARLDLQDQPHVLVVHGFRHHAVGIGRRHDRHLFTDLDAGFFHVAHADLRIRQHLGLATLLQQVQCGRQVIAAGHADLPLVQPEQIAHRNPAVFALRQHGKAQVAGVVHADFKLVAGVDFQHLHVHRHFGLRDVQRRHHALHHRHDFRRIAHQHRIGALVQMHVLGRADLPQRGQHVRGIRMVQVEHPHHQLAVFLVFVRARRVDQQGVCIQHLLFQLVGAQQQVDGVFSRGLSGHDAGRHAGLHVGIQHEVHARRQRNRVQDLHDGLRLEVQRNGLAQRIRQTRLDRLAAHIAAL
ncbi:hypothetical protein D3C71_1385070 [compost metagenome]